MCVCLWRTSVLVDKRRIGLETANTHTQTNTLKVSHTAVDCFCCRDWKISLHSPPALCPTRALCCRRAFQAPHTSAPARTSPPAARDHIERIVHSRWTPDRVRVSDAPLPCADPELLVRHRWRRCWDWTCWGEGWSRGKVKRGGNVCVCGSCCSLRTVPHSLLRCGWCWWCSYSCCLGGIIVNLRCFLLIILNFSFSFLFFFWREINTNLSPFLFCFLLCCLCRTFAWVLSCCCCCLCYFPLQKTNSLHTHTTTRNRCVSAYACRVSVFVCVCVRFTFSLLCCYSQWHNGTRRTELNWRIFLRVFTVPPWVLRKGSHCPLSLSHSPSPCNWE